MFLENLKIENLRNIDRAEINLSQTINIVTGANGAGKTTLLEAIYLLARARSFRRGDRRSLIKQGQRNLLLYASLVDVQGNRHRIGQNRQGNSAEYRIDGKAATRLSQIAQIFPIILITPQSHRILEEGPENRRRLLNWGVFHVEHEFKAIMADFSRILNQRNNALKKGSRDLSVWNKAFVLQAASVKQSQSRYLDRWRKEFCDICEGIPFLREVEMLYYQGWPKDKELKSVMKEGQERDRELGYTRDGPQRAEILFKVNGLPTKQILSRGQQKILIIVILLAQARLLEQASGEKPVILVDDLKSELDQQSVELICDLLAKQKSQTLITTTEPVELEGFDWGTEPRMFHVEHGCFC